MTLCTAALALALAAPATEPPAKAAAKPPAQVLPATGPEAVKALFGRELPPLARRPFKTSDGISGEVEAAAAPALAKVGDATELTVPLGTGQALSCSIFPSRLDAAGSIFRVVESAKQSVKLLAVRPADVLAVKGSALVLAILVYRLDGEKGPLAGETKVAVYAHPSRSFLCVHDEPGYEATFARVVKGLAASLEGGPADERDGAVWSELSVVRVGGLAVGFAEHVLWERKGGGRVSEQYGAQLLPRGPADLVAVDTVGELGIDGADLLDRGVYVHVTNGEIDTRVTVARRDDGKTYAYEGEKDGKKLEGSFPTAAGLSTDLWFARRLARAAPPPKADLVHQTYAYEANPVAATPVAWRRDPASPRRGTLELGAIRVTGELDDHGLLRIGEIPVGPTKLVIERLVSRGAP